MILAIGLTLAAILVLLLPGVPITVVLLALVIARTFTDAGATVTGPHALSSVLAGAIGVTILLLALLANRAAPALSRGVRNFVGGAVLLIVVWTLVGLLQFGIDLVMLSESLRLLSVLAAIVCGVRFGQRAGRRLLRIWPVLVVLPSAVVLLLLFAAGTNVGLESGRAAGTFSHSNSAAAFLAAGVLVLISAFFRRRSVVTVVAALVAGGALLATGSIGSVLGVLLGALAMFLARPGTRVATRVVAAVVVVGGAIAVALVTTVGQRIQQFSNYDPNAALASGTSTDSLEWRIINWTDLFHVWTTSPLFGWGIGSTAGRIQPLGEPPHSMFFQVLVEYGAIGFIVVLVMAVWAFRGAARTLRGTPEFGLLAGLVVFLIVTGSESNLIDYTAADYLLAVAVGIAIGRVGSRNRADEQEHGARVTVRSPHPVVAR